MSIEMKAELLKTINPNLLGIRDLSKALRTRPQKVIILVNEMEDEGLVRRIIEKKKTKGRPKTIVQATSLGLDFLKAYHKLELKPLRSKKTDLQRARKDAEYVKRLISRNKSPHKYFLELNSIVRRNQ
jgi:hypothetical protein